MPRVVRLLALHLGHQFVSPSNHAVAVVEITTFIRHFFPPQVPGGMTPSEARRKRYGLPLTRPRWRLLDRHLAR